MLLCLTLLSGFAGRAQNINRPNKAGPMGIEVNTKTGNLFLSRTDVYIPARQLDLDLTFAYNTANYNLNKGYGNGWILNYNMYYRKDSIGQVIIVWGDGREDTYAPVSGGFKSPTGIFDSLSQYQTGKYLLRQNDGMIYYFDDASHKRLTKMTEPNGNYLNFTYTNSLLTGISNAAGQSVALAYNSGRLSSITDANAAPVQTYTYTYDGYGNLTKVTDPMGGAYKYTYLVNGPMSSITDKNNNVADVIYYSGYAARELISCNSRTGFSYDTTTHTTTVIDFMENGNNQTSSYVYNDKGWLLKFVGACCGYNMTFAYDNAGNLTQRTDGNGNVWKYTYDNRGNYLTMTDPLNNVTTLNYTTDFNQVAGIVDPLGNIYTTTYDAAGNPVQVTRPNGSQYGMTYAGNGDLLTTTDANGNIISYQYDANGYLQKVTMPLNVQAQAVFDGRGNMGSFKDANGNNTAMAYDSLNRLKQVTDPLNRAMKLDYDKAGNLVAFTDGKGFRQLVSYDASNRMVNYKNAQGEAVSFTYDALDNPTQFSDALGNKISFAYDKQNRLAGITDALGNGYAFDYDNAGNVVSANVPGGNAMSYTYDGLNRLTSATDALGTLGQLVYDKNGNVVSFTNPTGAVLSFGYDKLNRLTKFTDPLGNARVFTYDNNGNLLTQKDRNNNVSSFAYNALNRNVSFTDNNSNTTSVQYDSLGNVTRATDQKGAVTAYEYDASNRPVKMTYPDGNYLQLTYDNNDNLTATRLADGTTITYAYDSANRVVAKTLPDGSGFSFAYDRNGRLLLAVNNTGAVTYVYDALGRLLSESFNGHTTQYTYDFSGRRMTVSYPNGTALAKVFDQRWRPSSLALQTQTIASYQYNGANQLLQKTFGNGISTTYQYDNMNRLSSFSSNNVNLPSLSFQYDKESNKIVVARANDPQYSETFAYDAGYRLTGYKQGLLNGNTISSPLLQNTFAYDAVGNRITAVRNGATTTYAVNNLNQYSSAGGVNYTYDGRGNRTFDGSFYSRYDAQGRKLVDSAAGMIIHYAYDAMGRRVVKEMNGTTVKYYYAGLKQIEERDGADNPLATQVFESSYMSLLRMANNQKYFYHLNNMGSAEAMTDSTGAFIERYRYDDFGNPSFYNGQGTGIASSAIGNRFLYTGQEYDAQSKTYKFHFRNYDAGTGTFVQRDPVGYADQMGLYQYVGNNPANFTDPLGLAPCPDKNQLVDKANTWESNVNGVITWTDLLTTWKYKQQMEAFVKFEHDLKTLREIMKEQGMAKEYWKLLETSAKNSKNIEALNATKLGKWSNALGKFGTGLNLLDFGIKSYQFGETAVNAWNGSADGTDVAMASGNLVQSATAFTPPGAIYNGVDFVQSKLTGKSMNEWSAEYGKEGGGAWSRLWGWDRVEEDMAASQGENFKKWREAEKSMIRKQRQFQIRKQNESHWQEMQRTSGGNGCPPNGPTPGTQNPLPPPPGQPGKGEVVFENDPNEIIGPDGAGPNKWVSVNDRLPYTILFENSKEATAPAKVVKVFYAIAPKQDINTFQLGSFGFNNLTFNVPNNTNAYYKRLDVRDSLSLYVDVTAGIDAVSRQAFWIFESIDPTTLLPTTEPLKGFLLTADSTNPTSGHGFVAFSIKPVSNAATRDTISVIANIVFGTNDTIPTNRYKNTIDALPPTSSLAALPALTPDTKVSLHLSGTDDAGGSGIKWYSIYVSDNGGPLQLYLENFSRTDTSFTGIAQHTYNFYIAATDSVGNKEAVKLAGTTRISNGEEVICPGGSITFESATVGATYQWQVNDGTGYVTLSNNSIYSGATTAILTLTGAPTSLYGYRYRAVVNGTPSVNEYLLKFGMSWEGTVSTAWENAANWSCGVLPDAATDVKINSEKTRYPQVSNSTAIRSLATQSGASVTVNAGVVLTIVK